MKHEKMKQVKNNSGWFQEQRRIVAYLDGLSKRVNALRRLQSESQVELSLRDAMRDALLPSPYGDDIPQGDNIRVG